MSLQENIAQTQQVLSSLLTYANSITKQDDVSVGDAIKTLSEGYNSEDITKGYKLIKSGNTSPIVDANSNELSLIIHDVSSVPDLIVIKAFKPAQDFGSGRTHEYKIYLKEN